MSATVAAKCVYTTRVHSLTRTQRWLCWWIRKENGKCVAQPLLFIDSARISIKTQKKLRFSVGWCGVVVGGWWWYVVVVSYSVSTFDACWFFCRFDNAHTYIRWRRGGCGTLHDNQQRFIYIWDKECRFIIYYIHVISIDIDRVYEAREQKHTHTFTI